MRGSLYLITRLKVGTSSAPRPIITESQPVTAIRIPLRQSADFTVGDHRDSQALADLAHCLPVDAFGFVAIFFGTAVHHQLRWPRPPHRVGDSKAPFTAVPAKTKLSPSPADARNRLSHGFRAAIDRTLDLSAALPRRCCRLVTNKQVRQQPVMDSSPAAWHVAADARAVSLSQSGERQYAANREEPDHLDIPAFLRKQAD